MANNQSLDVLYAQQMKNHPYGTALYTPLPYAQFHPGSVGYFSSSGLWNPVMDLSSPSSVPQIHLSPAPSETFIWGPKISTSTRAIKSSLDVELSSLITTAVPVDLGAFYKFESGVDGGAVLLTKGEVTHERFYYESPFKDWVRTNAERILSQTKDVRDYGLWIVTSTWSAQEAAVNCWKGKNRTVGAGFKTGLVGLGECAPSGEYVVKGTDEGWIRVVSKQGDNGKVVFFGGLRFRYRKVPFGEKLKPVTKSSKFRGDEHGEVIETLGEVVYVGERFELACESFLETVDGVNIAGEEAEEDEGW